jgi:hypothetical protein
VEHRTETRRAFEKMSQELVNAENGPDAARHRGLPGPSNRRDSRNEILRRANLFTYLGKQDSR